MFWLPYLKTMYRNPACFFMNLNLNFGYLKSSEKSLDFLGEDPGSVYPN